MTMTEPLFLQNKDWYTTPEDEGIDFTFLKMDVDITSRTMLRKKQKTLTTNFTAPLRSRLNFCFEVMPI